MVLHLLEVALVYKTHLQIAFLEVMNITNKSLKFVTFCGRFMVKIVIKTFFKILREHFRSSKKSYETLTYPVSEKLLVSFETTSG